MKNPKISVILPVFNVEKYLNTSVNALIHQSYKNLEIILVDDGSTDSSGSICDELKKQDKRIVVVHQKNAGVAAARNMGLSKATGEYIAFCDPDDILDVDMYESLLESIRTNGSDIAMCGFKYVYEDSDKIINIRENNLIHLDTKVIFPYLLKVGSRKVDDNTIETNNIMGCVWRALYKKAIIEGIEFERVSVCEDLIFTIDVFSRNPKVSIVDKFLYSYLQRNTSVMHVFNEKKFQNRIKAYKLIIERLDKLVDVSDLGAYKYHIYASLINDVLKNARNDIFESLKKDKFIMSLNTKENYKFAQQYVIGFKFKVAYFFLRYKMWWIYKLMLKFTN
jgi:glycosyltransferase involved in cell wall biosynthesis